MTQLARFLRLFLVALAAGIVAAASSGSALTVAVVVPVVVGAAEVAWRQLYPATPDNKPTT